MTNQNAPTMFSWLSTNPATTTQCLINAVKELPHELEVDYEEFVSGEFTADSIAQSALDCSHHTYASWETDSFSISLERPDTIKQFSYATLDSIPAIYAWLKGVPFEVCIGGALYSEWISVGFSNTTPILPGQYALGWLLAFKGEEGHKNLVSNRWLDYAPVKVHNQDDTFVQFHQVSANSTTALAQASSLLSAEPEGGFLPKYLRADIEGQYNREERSLSIVIVGRDLSLSEIQQACIARNFREVSDGREIKTLIYVFMESDRAERHLREIECHTFVDGKEVNLTESYVPPKYRKPDWVTES